MKKTALFAAMIVAGMLSMSGTAWAADKPAPDAKQKQMEDLGRIRGRITVKFDELKKVFTRQVDTLRYNELAQLYTKTRTNINAKITVENAKATKDQGVLDAYALKLQKMDEMWSKTLATSWNNFATQNSQLYQVIMTYMGTLTQICGYDDYWNRMDLDMQVLIAATAAVEARLDTVKTRMNAITSEVNKAMDEAEAVFKE